MEPSWNRFLCLYLTLLLDGGSRWRRGELSHTPFEPERKKTFEERKGGQRREYQAYPIVLVLLCCTDQS
eukprot:g386.t1